MIGICTSVEYVFSQGVSCCVYDSCLGLEPGSAGWKLFPTANYFFFEGDRRSNDYQLNRERVNAKLKSRFLLNFYREANCEPTFGNICFPEIVCIETLLAVV